MRKRLVARLGVLVVLSLCCAAGPASAEPKYVGVKDCGRCHKKELIGDQLGKWKEGPHAKAMEALKSDEAKKIAAERGLAKPPHEADECVKCHATAHGLTAAQVAKKPLLIADGVQCESCHGPGSDYRSNKVMSDHDLAVQKGMWNPAEDEKICTKCHNSDSPTWDAAKGFDFAKAKEENAHPIPEDVKGKYLELSKKKK